MNKTKLTALCAKAMGWISAKGTSRPAWSTPNRFLVCYQDHYNPLNDADQADALLEYMARKLNCSWSLIYLAHFGRYDCWLHRSDCVPDTSAETQNLAKILCALRASPEVTDAEINDAMEEINHG